MYVYALTNEGIVEGVEVLGPAPVATLNGIGNPPRKPPRLDDGGPVLAHSPFELCFRWSCASSRRVARIFLGGPLPLLGAVTGLAHLDSTSNPLHNPPFASGSRHKACQVHPFATRSLSSFAHGSAKRQSWQRRRPSYLPFRQLGVAQGCAERQSQQRRQPPCLPFRHSGMEQVKNGIPSAPISMLLSKKAWM